MEARSSSSDVEVVRSQGGALQAILPADVSVATTTGDISDAALFPEEAAAVAHAAEGRRREFATARSCARTALAGLGLPPGTIPVGVAGEPRWPAGVIGSITHCEGYRACAVASAAKHAAIGIDAEPNRRLPDNVLAAVTCPAEPSLLAHLAELEPDIHWGRLLFSAKEAVFKAWFSLSGRRLAFADATLTLDARSGAFAVKPRGGEPAHVLRGRWTLERELLLTAVAVPHPVPASFPRKPPAPGVEHSVDT